MSDQVLLRPLYLNQCECGVIAKCAVCRSKYQRRYNEDMTDGEKDIKRAMQRIDYANMTPEIREIRLAAGRVRQHKYVIERRERRKVEKMAASLLEIHKGERI